MTAESELESTLDRLETFGVRLGLDTTRRLLTALGDPQEGLRSVLVAGTNGKGSTAALLAGMVRAAGYRVGLYTSPHLESVEERLRIDGLAIDHHELEAVVAEVVATAESRLGYLPTYFETLTAAAFLWFARQSVELAVLEVGLGGRLDATNGCEPVLSLITEIGLEHQQYLGKTLASIGREKAGILRADRPALVWVEREQARRAIEEVADEIGARVSWGPACAELVSREEQRWSGQSVVLRTAAGRHELSFGLPGEHQVANLALATLAAERLAEMGLDRLGADAIAAGAAQTRWPGRLEWVEPEGDKPVLLDVAHNPDGARTLSRWLARVGGRYTLLFGALADKAVEDLLPRLIDGAESVVLTSPASSRAMDPRQLAPLVLGLEPLVEPDRVAALSAALAGNGDFVLVCGSVYLVGEVRTELRRRFGVPYPATASLQRS